jgi:hypothetical protein
MKFIIKNIVFFTLIFLGSYNVQLLSSKTNYPTPYVITIGLNIKLLNFQAIQVIKYKIYRGIGVTFFLFKSSIKTLLGSKYRQGFLVNYLKYTKWVEEIDCLKIYKCQRRNKVFEVGVKFNMSIYKIFYFYCYINQRINFKKNWIVWTLDRKYSSKVLKKSLGFWLISKYKTTNQSVKLLRVYSLTNIEVKKGIPTFFKNFLVINGLRYGILWIKNISQ